MRSLQARITAVALLMSLAACGGGGGGAPASVADGSGTNASSSPAPSPAPSASPGPAPAPSPAPDLAPAPAPPPAPDLAPAPPPAPAPADSGPVQPGALKQFAPVVLASDVHGTWAGQRQTATARLTGGGAVVLWVAGPSAANGIAQLMAQEVDASGNAVGATVSVGSVPTPNMLASAPISVTASPDGGWIAAWASTLQTVQTRRYDSAGTPIGDAITVDATPFAQVEDVQVRGAADGTFVVAWAATDTSASAVSRAYVRRFGADGSPLTDRVAVSNDDGAQTDARVVFRADGTVLAAWIQQEAAGAVHTVRAVHLDAQLSPLAAEQVVETAPPDDPGPVGPFQLSLATLSSGATLAAWHATTQSYPLLVRWQVLDASGAPLLAASGSSEIPVQRSLDTIEAVPDGAGFLIAVGSSWWYPRGGYGYTTLLNVLVDGSLLLRTDLPLRTLASISEVSLAGCGAAASGVAAAGGEDGHYVLAYEECGAYIADTPVYSVVKLEAR